MSKWTLAINNHRIYYDNRQFANSLGMRKSHRSVVTRLFSMSRDLVSTMDRHRIRSGVQFGAESEGMLSDPSMVEDIRKIARETDGRAVLHHPDRSTPGKGGFVSSLKLNLQRSRYLDSDWVIVHPSPDRSPMASRLTASEITDDVLVSEILRSGVGIALENLGPGRDPPTLGDLHELATTVEMSFDGVRAKVGDAAKNRIGICLDYGHLTAYSSRLGRDLGEVLEWLDDQSDMVVAMHVHLNDGSGDQHLLLGERPSCCDPGILDGYERLLLEEVVPKLEACQTFVIERNSPFRIEDLHKSARMLADRVPTLEAVD